MHRRWLSISLIVVIAGMWSLVLGVLGMWLLFEPHDGILSSVWVSGSAGVFCLCAAQVVFLSIAVDRLFPAASSRVRTVAQSGNLLILALSLGVLVSVSLFVSV
ncbi:MAG: hypothetical protein ACF8LL_03560 [Phycisphaerales bacterium]